MRPELLDQINETLWELPTSYEKGMQVPARIYGTEEFIDGMDQGVYDQAANVAALPGIVGYSFCMPDGHWGYGFPIGGTAAFDPEVGIISPGGIGFDINCGMRLVRTDLTLEEVGPKLERLVDSLFKRIPAGVGGSGMITLSKDEFRELITRGMEWSLDRGYATAEDLSLTEEGGRMKGADDAQVREKAISRGYKQVGTLGSGNHYLEVQVARKEDVVEPELAARLGIDRPNQVLLMLHTGSRGFGHQVATDYLQRFLKVMNDTYHLGIRDRELACAPFYSPEGQEYFAAMQCGVNIAFCNRQMILHGIREVFSDVFGRSEGEATFFTTAHGSGRVMGRRQAKRQFRGDELKRDLRRRGIYVRAVSNSGLAEEAGGAYKSIDAVVDAADRAGLRRKVVRLTPVGNIKG